MNNATLAPLRLWEKEVWSDESAPRHKIIGARWVKRGTVTPENVGTLIGHIIALKILRKRIPPMPEAITVEFTPREFAQLLTSDLADAKEWVMLNLTPRLVRAKRAVTSSARLTR